MKTKKPQNMKRTFLFSIIIFALTLTSCQSEIEKADKLRLENKFEEAAALYQKLADKGDAYAMWRLSKAYSNGDGVDFDMARAFELTLQAAQAGCEEAKCDMAFAYMYDWFALGKDVNKGKAMLEELVKTSDNSYVFSRYASLLFFGNEAFEEDREKAMSVIKKVKDKNNPFYCSLMGDIYFVGEEDIEIDEARGVEYYIKAFNNGRRYCAYRLQGLYAYGTGNIKADIPKQISWLKRGIESNQTDCMVTMALICLSEDSVYKEYHNPQKGIELLKRAAKHGDGAAYYNIGNLYYRGEYISKDDTKAFENWQKAVDLKNPEGGSNLAYAYIEGVGCNKDVAKGIEVYKQAVENGSGFSANKLYYMYWNGTNGVNRDSELAKYYLLRAAELNDEWACFNLGLHYYVGDGLMRQNYDQAFVYVKKAADMGLVDACAALAYFYEEGIGCNKNPVKAKEYKDKTKAKNEKEE